MGSSAEQAQWSPEKSRLCCQSEGLGCSNVPEQGRLFGTLQGATKPGAVPGRLGLQSLAPLVLLAALVGPAVRRLAAGPRAGYAEMLPDPALARGLQA